MRRQKDVQSTKRFTYIIHLEGYMIKWSKVKG
jgi:hypothetical protein